MITLLSPKNAVTFSLKTDFLKEFERRERAGLNKSGESSYLWMGTEERNIVSGRVLNAPVSVFFKWKTDDVTKPMDFKISLNPDLSPSTDIPGNCATVGEPIASAEEDGVYILRTDNLYFGRTYYWTVSDGVDEAEIRTFTTEDAPPRTIRAEHIVNIRDIGGYTTEDGHRVRQGLFYRGPAIRDDFNMNVWHVFMEDLGIKTEIDLRAEVVGKEFDTMLGPLCNYVQLPTEAYGEVFDEPYSGNYRSIFELLCDPEAYPVYVHCAAGADRTGMVALFTEALLGLREEDIIFDYNLTAASYDTPNFAREEIKRYLDLMEQRHPSTTLKEKLIHTLYDLGVTDEMFDKIRSILLEK